MTDGIEHRLAGLLPSAARLGLQFGWPLPRMAGGSGEGETGGEGGETETTEGGGEDAAQTGTSLDKLAESFEKFQGSTSKQFETLMKRLPEPEAEEEVEDESEFEFDFEDDDFDSDTGDLTPEAQQRALRQMIQQAVAEAQAPQLEQQANERRAAQADTLEEKYPALQDDVFQDEMIGETISFAQQIGRPELAREPALLEVVYLAHEARKQAGSEIPAGSQNGVTLERGSAASTATAKEEDLGARIVKAEQTGKFRPFAS